MAVIETHTEVLAAIVRVFDPGRAYPDPWDYCVTVSGRMGIAHIGGLQGGVDTAGRVAIFRALWNLGYREYEWCRKKPGGRTVVVRGPIPEPE